MYCFLGIIAQQDQQSGQLAPSYILCQSRGTSENRSGWRVVRQDETNANLRNMPKILVTELIGHEHMIDFLAAYRTRDHMHGDKKYKHENTKKYYPHGALCWFECNEFGEPQGTVIFIEKIPRKNKGKTDSGFARLQKSQSAIMPLKTKLAREPTCETNPFSCIKPRLKQGR